MLGTNPFKKVFIITFFLLTMTEAGKFNSGRQLAGNDGMISLLELPFISIEEICNGDIIEDFSEWYDVWAPRFLWQKTNEPARVQGIQMTHSIQSHINELQTHINNLEKEKQVLVKLPPAYLDIKINRINSEANRLINKSVPNKFEDSKIQELISKELGPNLPSLISHFNSFQVEPDLINLSSKSFKEDWDNISEPKDLISLKLTELAEPLRKTLREILRIHTQPTSDEHSLIDNDNKQSIQSFWDGFKFLLGDSPKLTSLIRNSLILTGEAPVPQQTFFTPDFFEKLREDPHDFKPELNRDQFLTLNDPKNLLEDIRAVAKPLFFSSDFPKEFTADPKYLNPQYVADPKDNPIEISKAKKIASLHKLLYLVYLLARLDNTIPHSTPMKNQEILKNLYEWVKNNNDFDDEPESDDTTSIKDLLLKVPEKSPMNKPQTKDQIHSLISPPVFRKNYLELLNLICSKIEGCKMEEKVKDTILLHKVGEFGNFDDIRPENPESVIPKKTIDAIKDELVKHNTNLVNLEVDKVLEDLSNIDIDDEDEEPTPGKEKHTGYLGGSVDDLLDEGLDDLKHKDESPIVIETIDIKPSVKPILGKKEKPVKGEKEKPSTYKPSEEELEADRKREKKKPKGPLLPSEKPGKKTRPVFAPTQEEENLLPVLLLDQKNQIVDSITSPKVSPKDRISPNIGDINKSHLKPKPLPKKQQDAIEKVFNRFIPTDKELDPPAIAFIKQLDDKANASESPEKKAALKNILINFLITRQVIPEKKFTHQIEEIANIVNTREVERLVNPISDSASAGLRNFFMMTLNPTMNLRYIPQTQAETHFYRHDLLFFVALYGERTIREIAKKHKGNKDLNKMMEPYTREIKKALGYLRNKNIDDKEMLAVLKQEKSDLLSKNIKLSKYMPAYDLFKTQFDFFDYFKVDDKESAEYANYRRVYLNFYTFLVSLRKIIKHEINRPHEFILANLHICLLYTTGVDNVEPLSASSVCLLSHRKYAEMYYFYRTYMLATDKPGVYDLRPAPGYTFDTNTNVYLNFVLQTPLYQSVFNNACKDSEVPICQSSVFFRGLNSYFRQGALAIDEERLKDIFKTSNYGSIGYFFNVLNALDASRLNILNGNVIDYSKSIDFKNSILRAIGNEHIKNEDNFINALALYLKRSYKRLFFTPAEAEANRLNVAILSSEETDLALQDSFLQVISINNEFLPENLSFFLQLATKTSEFKRIAKFIIESQSLHKLLDMKDESHFSKYRDLVSKIYEFKDQITADKKADDANKALINYIRDFMHKRIKESSSLCYLNVRNQFQNQVRAEEEYDMGQALLDELEEEENETEKSADDEWNRTLADDVAKHVSNSPQVYTVEQVVTIEVPEDQIGAIHMDLGLNSVNNIKAEIVGDEGFDMSNLGDVDPSRVGGVMLNGQKLNAVEFQNIAQRIKQIKENFNQKKDESEDEDTVLI